MTYGVPYSFVPGTKAKADEVNANFIEVLNKIDETNTRIDDSNANLETTNASIESLGTDLEAKIGECANLDLSNLSTAGKGVLNAKANTSIVDGAWVHKYQNFVNEKNIGVGVTQNFDLSSYLPNDSNRYQVMFSLCAMAANQGGACFFIYVKTDVQTTNIPICRLVRSSGAPQNSVYSMVIMGSKRTFTLYNTENATGTTQYTIRLHGYRKVR